MFDSLKNVAARTRTSVAGLFARIASFVKRRRVAAALIGGGVAVAVVGASVAFAVTSAPVSLAAESKSTVSGEINDSPDSGAGKTGSGSDVKPDAAAEGDNTAADGGAEGTSSGSTSSSESKKNTGGSNGSSTSGSTGGGSAPAPAPAPPAPAPAPAPAPPAPAPAPPAPEPITNPTVYTNGLYTPGCNHAVFPENPYGSAQYIYNPGGIIHGPTHLGPWDYMVDGGSAYFFMC